MLIGLFLYQFLAQFFCINKKETQETLETKGTIGTYVSDVSTVP
jgi:hypothetical protein